MKRKNKIRLIIHGASMTAAAVGAGLAQLPLADAPVLVGVQVGMIVGIAAVHGARITSPAAASLIGPFAAMYGGRAAAGLLVGWIPGAGNVINASTAAGITEAIGWAANKFFKSFGSLSIVEQIKVLIKGSSVAVLGAREVGKTSLLRFLSTGSIPAEYIAGYRPEKVESNVLKLPDVTLVLKKALDLPGADDFYPKWVDLCNESDIVLYLMRMDSVLVGDSGAEARVENDVSTINEALELREEKAKGKKNKLPWVFVVGTYCDTDPNFASALPNRFGQYADSLRKLPFMRKVVAKLGGDAKVNVVFGSTKTESGAARVVGQIFSSIQNNGAVK